MKPKEKKKERLIVKNDEIIKLDIGGGTNKRDEDFVSVDIQDGDVKADMWDIPYEDNVIDFIWSSHTLEHSGMYRVNQTLKEWFRILKEGHQAIIQVPNFDYVAKYWLTGVDRAWAEAMVFGHQAHDGEYHKCAFTAASLRADLEAVGFEVERVEIRWSHTQETLQAVCKKPLIRVVAN